MAMTGHSKRCLKEHTFPPKTKSSFGITPKYEMTQSYVLLKYYHEKALQREKILESVHFPLEQKRMLF